ncbi:hypothetical protein OM076_23565 [Solirubrobacter ginsenosidimutans]|uniref:PKD domain-containing protein n=2 Tax=Solirubrobacter ginsenosidimutans TaxID=490573 RepID=A0A9X3S784_9ACTN|nr:hypothetical protein [Solirubrobacter ginsenosidimutans]
MRAPLVLLAVLALGVVATTHSVDSVQPPAPINQLAKVTTQAVHDRSASLRGLAPQPAEAPVSEEVLEHAAGLSQGTEIEARDVAQQQPGLPDAGDAEQTSFGPRPAIATVTSFDNGLNGGSTSDNNIAAGPDSIVVMRNSQFKVMSKTGQTLFGPVNNNSIFAGTNEVQQIALSGYTADGAAYRLNYDGAESVPITRGQNNTAAGIQAALQGGNEQQQVALTNFTGTSSYNLKYGDAVSAPFVRGTNHTAAAILTALNGTSEVQTVAPSGNQYTLSYAGHATIPIVRGQNDTPAGIQNALQGGNEVQTITFSNFNAANPGNTFRIKIGGKLTGPLGFASALGDATPVTNQNVSDEINAIFGFAGTVTVTGASNTTGPTITFGGASAGKDVPPVEIVFGDCAAAAAACAATNREVAKASAPVADWPATLNVTAGTVTDAGFTLTFTGGLDVSPLGVSNGSVDETVKGAPGLLPAGTVATVGAVADTGYTLTFAGASARKDLLPLAVVNGSGTVRETVKGTPGVSNWLADTTVAIGTVADTGYTVTFNALTPLGSARETGLGDVPQLSVTGDIAGTVTTTTQGKPGIGQGACTNSGDGHIRYDQLAQRWLFTTPSFTRVGGLYAMCHAVSVGTDPTGPFYRYVFRRSLFPDYPRVAVWPDAYYNATSTGDTVIEKHACAVDRVRMLQGLDATEQCIIVPAVSFMEPADLDGQGLPPAGAPEHFFAAGGYQLRGIFEDDGIYSYKFHVDFADPSKSTFTGPAKITVSPYHFLCDGQLTQCVPQPGSTTRLDSQGDKLMHRAVYRNRGGTESIVMLHSIRTQAGAGGERWYELRLDGARDPYLYQHSTYAPDNHYRWLGSPAIDRKGDIALAFSYGGGPYLLPIATTLAAASAVGDTTIKVAGVSGANINFAPGRKINIGTGAALETATVESVGTAGAGGTGVTLTGPLALVHTSTSTVSNAAFMCVAPECVPVGQRYTARQPDDPLNTMSYRDGVIIDGISAAGGSRWEDWSNIAQDPTDDCTFWYFGGYGDASRTGGPFFGRTGAWRVPTCRLDASGAPAANITGRFDGPVASFTNSDLTAAADSFTADLDWGDGTHSAGVVTGGNGAFAIAGTHTYAEKGRFTVKTSITGTDGSVADARTEVANLSTTASGGVSGTVPATLGLSLGAPASFGAFTPGVAKDYVANMTANVVSTAGDAALSVADPSAVATGRLVNGTFSLPSALQAKASSPSGSGGAFADVTAATLLVYARPASNDPVALTFQQHIGASDPLRTGAYTKTLTFTLSTTTP